MPVLQQTLSQLRLTNIASLDACMNHFTRLIDLTSADEEYISKLATVLAPCILRPRAETSLTMEEKHAYRLVRDLFAHKDAIFNELKRLSTMNASASVKGRPRAVSTDESNRRLYMEERTRAILEKASGSRSRATSPAPPSPRAHRRDRSIGGPETRFPVQTSHSSPTTEHRKRQSFGPMLPKRTSLEVPNDDAAMGLSHPADGNFVTNGAPGPAPAAAAAAAPAATPATPPTDPQLAKVEQEAAVPKRNSLSRSGARLSTSRRVTPAAVSAAGTPARTDTPPPQAAQASAAATTTPPRQERGRSHHQAQHSVTLVDTPMDD